MEAAVDRSGGGGRRDSTVGGEAIAGEWRCDGLGRHGGTATGAAENARGIVVVVAAAAAVEAQGLRPSCCRWRVRHVSTLGKPRHVAREQPAADHKEAAAAAAAPRVSREMEGGLAADHRERTARGSRAKRC